MSELVLGALTALGRTPARRELELVAEALRRSGDAETLSLFGLPADGATVQGPEFDREACGRVQDLAVRAGTSGFVGLDLYTETIRPGWTAFGAARPRR